MNYGHFFHLNTEKSDLTQGITVFDYKGVISKEPGKHDVYAFILDDGVHFEYHFHHEKDSSHVHTDIAFLPFASTTEVHDRLSRVIEECHDVTFPDEIDNRAQNPVEINNPLKKNHTDSSGYSRLSVFSVGETKDDGNIIRRMILDFLFDMEHSTVFQVSSYYGQVREMLHSNALTAAILARAEYYYQRQQQQEKDYILDDRLRAQLIYANDYTLAERKWVDFLCSEHAGGMLAESAWLKTNNQPTSVSQELSQVYMSKENGLTSCDYVNSIAFPKEGEEKDKIKKEELCLRVKHTAQRAQAAYLHHYDILGTLCIWFDNGLSMIRSSFPFVGLHNFFLPRLMAAIVAAWLTIIQCIDKFIFSNSGIHSSFILLLLMLFLIIYVYHEIRKKNIHLKRKTIICREIVLLSIAFFYSIIVGLCFLGLPQLDTALNFTLYTTIGVFIGIFINMLFEDRSITES